MSSAVVNAMWARESLNPPNRPASVCAQCGTESSPSIPGGLCPKCLIGSGLQLLSPESAETELITASRRTSVRRFGDYELIEEIARGGMGVVYRARQISLDRVVAVKMLLFGEFSSDEFVRRFRYEAEAAAALQHPNIVAIHEIGEHDGAHYFSMDYVEGHNLADAIRDRPLPVRKAAECVRTLARTVHYAHQRGVLHRDLKPSNVLIDAAGHPRLTDFGLAKRFDNEAKLSGTGQLIGSPNYMPPEQAAPERGPAGPASDVYSLGAILYHLLSGRPPVMSDTLEATLLSVLRDDPVSLRLLNGSVPRDLETICLKCLQKNPARRYGSAQALAEDLDRYLQGKPIRARSAGWAERLFLWCRRKPAVAAAIGLLVLVATGSAWTANHLSGVNRLARWDTYVSEMSRAQNEWNQGHFAEAFFYLRRQMPQGKEKDLRGFEWRHLWNLTRGNCAAPLPLHADVVSWLGFSPDGQSLATFAWDGTNGVQVWDVASQSRRFVLPEATSVGGFSADGELFVAGRDDRSVIVHDARTGAMLKVLPNVGAIVAFAPEAKTVVTMDAGRLLTICELQTGRVLISLTNAARRFFDVGWNAPVSISPDGSLLAVIRPGDPADPKDRGVELWNTASGAMDSFLPHARQIRIIQFSPGGETLAVADGDGGLFLWRHADKSTNAIQAHELSVQALAFSSDGQMLATGAFDEGIKLWDARTLAQLPYEFNGQIGAVWSLAFSPLERGRLSAPEWSSPHAAAAGREKAGKSGLRLASGSRDMPIHLWNLTAAARPAAITNLNTEEFGNFAFSADAKLMASGCKDNHVRIWEVETLKEIHRLRGVSYTVAFSRQGNRLLVANAAGTAYWWNFTDNTRQPVPSYEELGEITSVEISGDRRIAAVGHKSGTIQLVEIDSGKLAGTYTGHRDAILSLSFAPDGRTFASGSKDKDIRLWDVAITNQSRQVCAEHKGGVAGLAISSDGRRMASGCNANTIKFWDLRHPHRSLGARSWHRSAIRTLAFSPDNERLASGSEDRSVKLWDFSSRRELANFEFDAAIKLVTFSPDSNYLAVITEKGSLHVLRATKLSEADRELQTLYAVR